MSSRGEQWVRVRTAEEMLALVMSIDDRRRMIRVQAWREGSWDAVFVEATAMKADVAELRAEISARWAGLMEAAEKEGPEGATSGPMDRCPG